MGNLDRFILGAVQDSVLRQPDYAAPEVAELLCSDRFGELRLLSRSASKLQSSAADKFSENVRDIAFRLTGVQSFSDQDPSPWRKLQLAVLQETRDVLSSVVDRYEKVRDYLKIMSDPASNTDRHESQQSSFRYIE